MENKKNNLHLIVTTAVLGALVFVSNYISIPIPIAIGDVSRIHIANGICILSGLVLGPIGGGLAAGIGSALYDFTNPAYIASAPFTLIFKFILAAISGLIYHKIKFNKNVLAIVGAVLGQIAYIALYISKGFFEGLLQGYAVEALIPSVIAKLGTSSINAIIAVAISYALFNTVKLALQRSSFNTSFSNNYAKNK